MVTKQAIIDEALRLGFEDVGFTTAEPFESHRFYLQEHAEEYSWAESAGLSLLEGTNPRAIFPKAQTIIVLLENYCRQSFPTPLVNHFGRCYLDDDRITRDGLSLKIKAFRGFLRENAIDSRVPFNLPHRLAAARAGLGTLGKNCLFYAGRVAAGSSWVLPITVVVDRAFEADEATIGMGCPTWCRGACVAACPTQALKGGGRIDPRRCISYLSYFGQGLTPLKLRAPMGLYVYGCDRCQLVCPRNAPWLARNLPVNQRVAAMAPDFDLARLLRMDVDYFQERIWPHMFYMGTRDMWRWRMNAARAMGNTLDPAYIPELAQAFAAEKDERVQAMIAWALGRIGGNEALSALQGLGPGVSETVSREINQALQELK
ncbi:MAG TPA: 4Fe-4S double cluster binding domain-containing protein [Deltaproteobacteria bacterium]|nr:4Fe-4S double cluster binding domain-containing protein [Deltaproteobacteria bacterium]